ncbi:FixH family protein [Sungkyunkwania multivorans]|uniref:FixH family protein n=1 Tax=Sungkyunkwania multivorans TaxID=1173618 RepID=A0ABW3D4A0_9FLAO
MKINWGTGIVITFIAFIGFILYFVITLTTNSAYHHELVTEKYYEQELGYQKEIDAERNARALPIDIVLEKTAEGMEIRFPESLDPKAIKGKISLYRPSNKQLDFDIPIVLSKSHLLIPEQRLVDGRWDIKIHWEYDQKEYLFKKSITY